MYEIVNLFLRPFTILILLEAFALVRLWRRRRETSAHLWLATIPFVLLILISSPAVSYSSFASLESALQPLIRRPDETQALVVLAGSMSASNAKRPEPELTIDSIYRCLHAAELYHRGPRCPIMLSGGHAPHEPDSPPLSHLMREFMVKLGVEADDLLVEDRSTTTYENAVQCYKLLDARQVRRIVLVTDASHMKRAASCFASVGFTVVPAPCSFRTGRFDVRLSEFIPTPDAAVGVDEAAHEWLGLVWYWLHGRL